MALFGQHWKSFLFTIPHITQFKIQIFCWWNEPIKRRLWPVCSLACMPMNYVNFVSSLTSLFYFRSKLSTLRFHESQSRIYEILKAIQPNHSRFPSENSTRAFLRKSRSSKNFNSRKTRTRCSPGVLFYLLIHMRNIKFIVAYNCAETLVGFVH